MWSERDGISTIGEPEESDVAIVCCVHGDEPCGKLATERVVEEYGKIEGVMFVLANPRAYAQGRRYIDEDLNRAFPGDPSSESYEERLAARLIEALGDQLVLDIHSTVSSPTPFVLFQRLSGAIYDAIRNTGIKRAVDIGFVEGGLIKEVNGVSVEFDKTDPEGAVDDAYRTARNFLANYGLIDAECMKSNPVVYRIYDEIPKECPGFDLIHENFERVAADEIFARREEVVMEADEAFYPVLTSEEGYDEIYGFKAEREGRISGLIR